VLTWADGDSGCIRQRRAKVRRDRRDSEPADMDVFDRVKTPEPAGVLESTGTVRWTPSEIGVGPGRVRQSASGRG
jgi:hypothetical protein